MSFLTIILMLMLFSSCYQVVTSFSNLSKKTSHLKQSFRTSRSSRVDEDPSRKERTVVILYHKPKGVITSHSSSDPIPKDTGEERITVYQDIMSMKGFIPVNSDTDHSNSQTFEQVTGITSKLHAIGRLDADTTGLLLLTNDGGLVHHVTNPTASTSKEHKLIKTYEATIMGHHTLDTDSNNSNNGSLNQLLKGVDIGAKYGGMTLPADELKVLDHPTPKSTRVLISISEGRNRQVRRMFHAIQSGVMQLKRRRVGRIDLDMLGGQEGSWRVLTEKEVLMGLGWESRTLMHEDRKHQTTNTRNPPMTGKKKRSKSKR